MSNQSPFAGRTAQAFPTLPKGDVLGTYDSYPDAQRVVAKLAEADFPVNQLSIVGNDLKTVERVTGKMTYGRAAIAGALSGLWLGIFFGIVLTLFSPSAGGLILAAAIIGAAFGMLYGIVSFAITKRQRDFTSVHQVLATNYQIVVAPQLTGQARRILGEAGIAPATHWNPGTPGAPGAPGAGFQGQPPQQPWRPGPQGGQPGQSQGSPYGGHATPHQQPGGTQQPGTSAPAGQAGAPRYGTNDGPRYGETPATAPAPTEPPAAAQPRPEEPPRYGERVAGATPTSAPASPSDSASSGSSGSSSDAKDDESR
ncbi:ECF transporter S component [Curtobacterium sp. MCPF17_002]|uniref:general stress protein n=1 Tax=Curtobacterium sp. MCPF17_002 TaxID=2175645 RepID=UPI000DA8511C|nr:general stress protein [Curtobacterium sp. MCPF17_002]WIB78414.1 ECF transporter S component [Curtobacterium sp. MCPF17_002]